LIRVSFLSLLFRFVIRALGARTTVVITVKAPIMIVAGKIFAEMIQDDIDQRAELFVEDDDCYKPPDNVKIDTIRKRHFLPPFLDDEYD